MPFGDRYGEPRGDERALTWRDSRSFGGTDVKSGVMRMCLYGKHRRVRKALKAEIHDEVASRSSMRLPNGSST